MKRIVGRAWLPGVAALGVAVAALAQGFFAQGFFALGLFAPGLLAQDLGASPEAVRARIAKADATVVPTLRRWLGDGSDSKAIDPDDPRLAVALYGAGVFGDAESARLASFFYQRVESAGAVRSAAALAVATLGAQAALKDLKQIVWDQRLELATRCRAAESLVQLDNEMGRRFLLLQYDLYRLELGEFGGGNMGLVRESLRRLDDQKMVAELELRLPLETGKLRNNITTLIVEMKINAESVSALAARVADASRANSYGRYSALEALGRKGDRRQIPLLESLAPWEGMPADAAQQLVLRDVADAAILAIRHRCWD